MDMISIALKIFSPLITFLWTIMLIALFSVFFLIAVFSLVFVVKYFPLSAEHLENLSIEFKPYDFIRWQLVDFEKRKTRPLVFKEFGFSIFVGKQGAGKTISMVKYLELMRHKYPNALIVTNFKYSHSFKTMTSWRDLMQIRNGEDGIIFAIDEIHSEYSSAAWNDFPESLLSEISQQRKQRIKIVATSQVFSRIAKPIREQAFSVFVCNTFFNRFTTVKEFDAAEYGTSQDSPYKLKEKCKPFNKFSFVQSDELRNLYDTYEKIKRMAKLDFIPRETKRNSTGR